MNSLRREVEQPEISEAFVALVATRLGLQIDSPQRGTLLSLVVERTRALRLSHPHEYLSLLRNRPTHPDPEWARLAEALTVTESYFFRDDGQYSLIESWIIPELQSENRQELNVWSAGCARGEEIYSLSILLHGVRDKRPDQRTRLVGTDINAAAVAQARSGVYRESSLRRLDSESRNRWFEPINREWQIREVFRASVEFHVANLLEDSVPGEFDLVICRNVFIFFTPDARARASQKLTRALRPGGYLITGHNELFGTELGELVPRLLPEGLAYRRQPPGGRLEHRKPAHGRETRQPEPKIRRRALSMPPPGRPKPPVSEREADKRTSEQPPVEAVWALADAGQLEEAERSARQALERTPTEPGVHFLLAYIALQAGRNIEARRQLKRTLYLDAGFIPAYVEFAALYDREGEFRAARRIRRAGLDVLAKFPPETPIPPYDGVTAAQLKAFLGEREAFARRENR